MATPEQERAKFALQKVESVATQKDEYKTQLLKLPARLHTNGLGQALAFYLADDAGSPKREIYGWLGEWLKRNPHGVYPGDNRDLIECIVGNRVQPEQAGQVESRYREASAEARTLSVWLKRFAEAFL